MVWFVLLNQQVIQKATIQPGDDYTMNTDTTFWILSANDSCDDFPGNASGPLVVAPAYFNFNYQGQINASGYLLTLCVHDRFPYNNTMMGPIINTHYFLYDDVWQMDTISASQLPQIVADCATCSLNLNLSTTHNFPTTYQT